MRKYIALKDDKIVKVFMTSTGIKDIEKSCQFLNLSYDKIEETPLDAIVHSKMHKNEFKKGWKIKTLQERVAGGYVELNPHFKAAGDEVIEKTIAEKIADEVITLQPYEKYDTKTKSIVIDEALLPAPPQPTQAELLSELNSILLRAKDIENILKG